MLEQLIGEEALFRVQKEKGMFRPIFLFSYDLRKKSFPSETFLRGVRFILFFLFICKGAATRGAQTSVSPCPRKKGQLLRLIA